MTYDKAYFIQKFEAIPEENWITHAYSDYRDDSRHCAMGHCGVRSCESTDEGIALSHLFDNSGMNPMSVNDGDKGFESFGSTPKQRILHALNLLP